jgi:hypothetical protein
MNVVYGCGLDSNGSGWRSVAGFYEKGNVSFLTNWTTSSFSCKSLLDGVNLRINVLQLTERDVSIILPSGRLPGLILGTVCIVNILWSS